MKLSGYPKVTLEFEETPSAWADVMGQEFGRLKPLGFAGRKTKFGQKMITCECSCGLLVDTMPNRLRTGNTRSCGCLFREAMVERNQQNSTHGHTKGGVVTPEYRAWAAMLSRCSNDKDSRFKWYGARGIRVCKEWVDSFEEFLVHIGPRPSRKHSLGRIDNDGNYAPGNVEWQLPKDQIRNKRNTVKTSDGRTLGEMADAAGIPYDIVQQRVDKFGWTPAKAASTPVGKGGETPRCHRPPKERLKAIWYNIKSRCLNPEDPRYHSYGGRGITVCSLWRDSFEAFYAAVGDPPSDKVTLDRIDNSKGYEPGNMRWATATVQNRNRRSTKRYELYGQTKTLSEWAELAGTMYETVKRRILTYKWPLEEALGTPEGNLGRSAKTDRVVWKAPWV